MTKNNSPFAVFGTLGVSRSRELYRNGYIVLNNFASVRELLLLQQFSDLIEAIVSGKANIDCLDFASEKSGYMELRNSERTIVQLRGKLRTWDIGLTDVFNPHFAAIKRFPELESLFLRLKHDSLVSLMASLNPKIKVRNTNLYVHRGVVRPRVPHIDSIRNYFKGFLAISDHSVDGSGPLGVIPLSHNAKLKNYLMCLYNRRVLSKIGGETTDATFYSRKQLTHLKLKPGDLALCNVSMVHGAMPAAPDGYRSTLVQCFDI